MDARWFDGWDRNRTYTKLTKEQIKRCEDWADFQIRTNNMRNAYTYRNADKNRTLLIEAKMAECVFAVEHNLDPLTVLNWTGDADVWDVIYKGKRVDVKHTPRGTCLIWSKGKNARLHTEPIDVLVLTKAMHRSGDGYCHGWVTKLEFIERHLTAGSLHFLDEGTRYMEQKDLHPMDTL